MILEMIADMDWMYIMLIFSSLAVLSFHCYLLHPFSIQWVAGDWEQRRQTKSELVFLPEPILAVPRVQQKIPALQDRSHDDDDDETSFPPYFT